MKIKIMIHETVGRFKYAILTWQFSVLKTHFAILEVTN